MSEIYVSCGAFISKLNGRDYKLLPKWADKFECDGFEFMMYPDFYDCLGDVVDCCQGFRIPVFHADKVIGDRVSDPEPQSFDRAKELLEINLETAEKLGASKMVVHCWGIPDSDRELDMILERIVRLYEFSLSSGIDMLVENCVCVHGSPLSHLEELACMCENIGLIVDVRCARFHGELKETMCSSIWRHNVRHVHISDFAGECGDWTKLRPILLPGCGTVDWAVVRDGLKENGYRGSFTIESPSLRKDGTVDPSLAACAVSYLKEKVLQT